MSEGQHKVPSCYASNILQVDCPHNSASEQQDVCFIIPVHLNDAKTKALESPCQQLQEAETREPFLLVAEQMAR